jgi:hypothetical protein
MGEIGRLAEHESREARFTRFKRLAMRHSTTLLSLTALLASWLFCAGSVQAGFTLIDNFESYSSGSPIHGQGDWQAERTTDPVSAGVTIDPLNSANRVMNIGAGGFVGGTLGHRETINTNPALRVTQGSTATLFFRLAWDTSQVNLSVGMTDVANPINDAIFNSFTQFESQLQLSFTPGFDMLAARDGGSFDTLTTDVSPLEWYNVWMVIDNAAGATQIYLQGGAFTTPTLLDSGGQSSFTFRNGVAGNDLLTFFIATGRNTGSSPPNPTENIGPVYFDDVYIDTTGVNLLNPVPEPGSLALGLIGFCSLAAVAWRHRRRDQ